jgi:hypothetical protein
MFLMVLPVFSACDTGSLANESNYGCNHDPQSNELVQSPGGLSVSAEFEQIDVNYSEPIIFTIFAQNHSASFIRESITIRLAGYHLANPLVATMVAHKTITEYPINLEVHPGETICQNFIVDMDTYLEIGTGNYNLYFVEAEDHLAHMNLSGALEIMIIAPESIDIDQNLLFQVKVHNPTHHTINDISVRELHLRFKEFIPALLPGETATFSYTIFSSAYQNTNIIGVTVLTETLENGADLANINIEIEGYFEE